MPVAIEGNTTKINRRPIHAGEVDICFQRKGGGWVRNPIEELFSFVLLIPRMLAARLTERLGHIYHVGIAGGDGGGRVDVFKGKVGECIACAIA